MPTDREDKGTANTPAGAFARLSTGAKVFLLLSAALLPLALIAFFAAIQTTRNAGAENRARLRVAAAESARTLSIELVGDMNALRTALAAIERDPADTLSCARVRGVFTPDSAAGGGFAIVDAVGQLRCGTSIAAPARPADSGIAVAVDPARGLTLTIAGSDGLAHASAYFPANFLADVSRPSGFVPDYSADIRFGGKRLTLRALEGSPLARRDRLRTPVGIADLELELAMPSAPITSPVLIAMLLPILMWFAAAGIAWFVTDRLLIRPMRQLRRSVGAYQPGLPFDAGPASAAPAHELRELDDAFRKVVRTVEAHEGDLAEGLVRQTRLTREVHHRVKNNLQVIASLINFHSRSAASSEVTAAYASIQRRVDALAVVHRHHFAEMEVSRGLGLRAVIGELAANLRATAPEGSPRLGMTLDIEPFLVSQDTAVAIAFLVTELVELAMSANVPSDVRVTVSATADADRALLRLSSPALVENDRLREMLATRYGRVIEGLSRQLRSKLHHDPLTGAFEIVVAVVGRD